MITYPDLSDAKRIAIDLETYDPAIAESNGTGALKGGWIAGISIATDTGFREYYPVAHSADNLPKEKVYAWLKEQLARPYQEKVGANLIYDLEYLAVAGIPVVGRCLDVQIAEPLLDENQWSYALEVIAQKYLGEGKVENELKSWILSHVAGSTEKKWKQHIHRAPGNIARAYALGDTDLPLRIIEKQLVELEKQDLLNLFYLESDLIPMLLAMKLRGVRVDLKKANDVYHELSTRISSNQSILGPNVNVNAASSLAAVWDRNGLSYPLTEKTKKPSFTKDSLAACHHPVARLVESIRKDTKLRDTFIKNAILDQHINGRIHCQFNQMKSDDYGTVSGRFSSSNPNLQQIPSRGEGTELIRQIFVPEDGEDWYSIDFSQIEYRVFAHYAEDDALTRAYMDPKADFHDQVGGILGGVLDRKIVKCVAEGELVLTDKGLVPIEQIKSWHRIWDGVEWVHHDGVVFTGHKEVITYEGLTATPDHRVFTTNGNMLTLEAAQLSGSKLARTEVCGNPIKFKKIRESTRLREKMSGLLRNLRERILVVDRQSVKRTRGEVCVSKKQETSQILRRNRVRGKIQYRKEEMRISIKSRVQELWSSWNKDAIHFETALYNLLFPDVWASLQCEESGVGSNKQQRSLRTRKHQIRNPKRKSSQQKEQCSLQLARDKFHVSARSMGISTENNTGIRNMELVSIEKSGDRELDYTADSRLQTKFERTRKPRKIQRTFGIQNAGPNFRFTVSGVLTKNTCNFLALYGGGPVKLAKGLRTNMSEQDVDKVYTQLGDVKDPLRFNRRMEMEKKQTPGYTPDLFDLTGFRALEVYDERFPAAKKLAEKASGIAKQRGYIRTLLNRRRRFAKGEATYKALNALCQGTAADIMKKSMLDIWQSGVCDVIGVPMLTVHDEVNFSVPRTKEGREAVFEAQRLMNSCVQLDVPILTDIEVGPDWGHVEDATK